MGEKISEIEYAHYTSRFGPNMFYGLIEVIESNIKDYNNLVCHDYPEGNVSSTKRDYIDATVFEIAVSMSYTNLHSFFVEEYNFYVEGKKPKHLKTVISKLIECHGIEVQDQSKFLRGLELLRRLRNRICHDIGRVESDMGDFGGDSDFDLKKECDKFFGAEFFYNEKSYFTSSPENSVRLVKYFSNFVVKYCDAVVDKKSSLRECTSVSA